MSWRLSKQSELCVAPPGVPVSLSESQVVYSRDPQTNKLTITPIGLDGDKQLLSLQLDENVIDVQVNPVLRHVIMVRSQSTLQVLDLKEQRLLNSLQISGTVFLCQWLDQFDIVIIQDSGCRIFDSQSGIIQKFKSIIDFSQQREVMGEFQYCKRAYNYLVL